MGISAGEVMFMCRTKECSRAGGSGVDGQEDHANIRGIPESLEVISYPQS